MTGGFQQSAFFLKYKDLFEYDKYVGSNDTSAARDASAGATGASSTASPSFLDRYLQCQQAHMDAWTNSMSVLSTLQPAPLPLRTNNASTVTTALRPFPTTISASASASKPVAAAGVTAVNKITSNVTPQAPSSTQIREQLTLPTASWPQQLTNDQQCSTSGADLSLTSQDRSTSSLSSGMPREVDVVARSPLRREQPPRGPGRPQIHATYGVPALSSMLIDEQTRASILGHRRQDEAQKIERLMGAKYTGRVSTLRSHLPPAIRHRLERSAQLTQRRSQLYQLLARDHARFKQLAGG